jgi:hypothetical protein
MKATLTRSRFGSGAGAASPTARAAVDAPNSATEAASVE